MLNKFTYFFVFVIAISISSITYAQDTHTIDFEPDGTGADWTWEVAENDTNPPMEFIANPDPSGANTSNTVAKFTALATGNPWALVFTSDDGEFTFDENNAVIKMMVHKSRVSSVAFKFEGGTGTPKEIASANTVTGEWEELTFDFSEVIGQTYSRFVIIPDLLARTEDEVVYIDNIQLPDGVFNETAMPETAAPSPERPEASVISVFSDAYTNIEGTDLNPNWGQSTRVDEITIDDNNTLLYEFLNYQGTQLGASQDLTGMMYMHLDYWTENSTALGVSLISQTSGEQKFDVTVTNNEWVGVDIPLSHYSDLGLALTDIHQIKIDGNGSVYFDNIYFYQEETSIKYVSNTNSLFTIEQNYPNPFTDNTMIRFELKESNNVELKVYDSFGQEVAIIADQFMSAGSHEIGFNSMGLSSGNYFVSITVGELRSTKMITLTR